MSYEKIENIEKIVFIKDYLGYPYEENEAPFNNIHVYTIEKNVLYKQKDYNPSAQIYILSGEIQLWLGRNICFGELYDRFLNEKGRQYVRINIEMINKIGLLDVRV